MKEGKQYWGKYVVVRFIEDIIRDEPVNIGIMLWNHKKERIAYYKFPWIMFAEDIPWFRRVDPDNWEKSNEIGSGHGSIAYQITDPRGTYIGETDKEYNDTLMYLYERFVA